MIEKENLKRINNMLIYITRRTLPFTLFEMYFNYLKKLLEEDYYLINTANKLLNARVDVNLEEQKKYQEYKEYLSNYINGPEDKIKIKSVNHI